MIDLSKDVQFIKGVGPNRATLLKKLNIYTLGDLITYFPRDYEDRGQTKNIAELENGEESLISAYPVGRVNEIRIRRNLCLYKLLVRDESGSCMITWYNQSYIKSVFKPSIRYKFYGRVTKKLTGCEMSSPVYEPEDSNKNTGKIIPIYPLTYSLTQNTIRKIIETGLENIGGSLDEVIPDYIREKYKLLDYNDAIHKIHFPETFDDFKKARYTLAFEELLSMQLALLSLKNKYEDTRARNSVFK